MSPLLLWIRLATALFVGLVGASIPGTAVAQSITKFPMLSTFRGDEMQLQWETDSNPGGATHEVHWGDSSTGENSTASFETQEVAIDRFVHRATITGLQPGTQYVYLVQSGAALSPEFSFRTAPLPKVSFRMAWISDNQGGAPFPDVLNRIASRGVDVIGHAGDTVADGTLIQQWHDDWYVPLTAASNLVQSTPLLVTRGNHDGEGPAAYSYLWLPGNGSYYAQTIGRTRLIVLNSNEKGTAQTLWLESELASAEVQDADFVIVTFHKLPFTNLWDISNNYNGDPWVRANWVPLFEQYGVDLVVCGHAHAYERGTLNGVLYTVVGGAGGALDTFIPLVTWSHIDVALPVHHYVIMEVQGSLLTWTAYDLDDAVIDSFVLSAGTPIPALPIWAAAALGLALWLAWSAQARVSNRG